ncbi:hypothetical protein CERSUDRAFT_100895 [Gelatoporia subvermispora B]|uniref:Uncharacterized protein n=1 Tax=Ceriporiopsis subvermispora (strain B) TaxID=914234 RepID=M2QWK0_CERS8|nr:hypothetical protein CERSUDRAFT_100895 [Gelatoporia subvermispora B]
MFHRPSARLDGRRANPPSVRAAQPQRALSPLHLAAGLHHLCAVPAEQACATIPARATTRAGSPASWKSARARCARRARVRGDAGALGRLTGRVAPGVPRAATSSRGRGGRARRCVRSKAKVGLHLRAVRRGVALAAHVDEWVALLACTNDLDFALVESKLGLVPSQRWGPCFPGAEDEDVHGDSNEDEDMSN